MKILVISPLASHQPTGGAKKRIYNLLWHLKKQGHEIIFVYTCHEDANFQSAADQMAEDWDHVELIAPPAEYAMSAGEDYGVDDWIAPDSGKRVKQICDAHKPDLVLIQYVFQSYYADFIPDEIPVVLDAHDKLSRRHLFDEAGIEPGFFYTTEEEELRGLARVDLILSIQDLEASYFARSGKPVVVAGHIAEPQFVNKRFDALSRIGLIAAYNKFNIHALETTLPHLLQRLDDMDSGVQIHIAGNVCSAIEIEHPKLFRRGFVQSLQGFYESLDLVLNPTLQGTGLKIKTIEAMQFGMPVLSTKVGFDGIAAMSPYHQVPDAPALADALEELHTNQFGSLTKLANISRSVFSEYALNLESNLAAVFSEDMVRHHRDGSLGEFLSQTTTKLADRDDPNHKKLRDLRPTRKTYKFGHIINPVDLGPTSDLYIAQPITFESMRRARDFAAPEVDVELMSVAYEEDADACPKDGFKTLPVLKRSVLDVGTFSVQRKLPLLRDLIQSALDNSDADYLIYTNVDIALTPQFYTRVAEYISKGCDAVIINRRTLSKRHARADEISSMFAEYGADHPGYDCFVIKRSLAEKFDLGNICIGVHLIGRALLWNIMAHAQQVHIEKKEHLTFHIGDDVPSKDVKLMDYIQHNASEALGVIERLEAGHGLLTRLRDEKSWNLITLNFGPKQFKEFRNGKVSEALARPIFIHALFRAGSTYLWQKMRRMQSMQAYYEPFHEDIALMEAGKLQRMKTVHSISTFHKLDEGDWLFKELEPLMFANPDRTVPHFDRRFAYDYFAEPADTDSMQAYVEKLIEAAAPKTPLLQFNRTSLRQKWFKETFPEASHWFMMRTARSQWGSYASFVSRGRMGFLRNTVMLAGKNAGKPKFAPLAKLVPLVGTSNVMAMHQAYERIYETYELSELYLMFYYIWLLSVLEGAEHADVFIDMDRLSNDPVYQMRIEFEIMRQNIEMSLSDANLPAYDPESLGLSDSEFQEIEDRVHAAVVNSFDVPFERLHQLGLAALAGKLERAKASGAPPSPEDLEERNQALQLLMKEQISAIVLGNWAPTEFEPAYTIEPKTFERFVWNQPLRPDTTFSLGGVRSRSVLVSGWDVADVDGVWTNESVARFQVKLLPGEDVSLTLRCKASTRKRKSAKVTLDFDGIQVYSGTIGGDSETITFEVPDRLCDLLEDHELTISCRTEAHDQTRSRGLQLQAIKASYGAVIEPVVAQAWAEAKAGEAEARYTLKSAFPLKPNFNPILLSGWSFPEQGFVWSVSKRSVVRFHIDKGVWSNALLIQCRSVDELAEQGELLHIRLNGDLVFSGPLSADPASIVIHGIEDLLHDEAPNDLAFEVASLHQPAGDSRELGLLLESVSFCEEAAMPSDAKIIELEGSGPYDVRMWTRKAKPIGGPQSKDKDGSTVRLGEAYSPDSTQLEFASGWSYSEGTHIWAIEPKATINVKFDESCRDAQKLCITCNFVDAASRKLLIKLDGKSLGRIYPKNEAGEHELTLKRPLLPASSASTIELIVKGKPLNVLDGDGRPLQFCFKGLKLAR